MAEDEGTVDPNKKIFYRSTKLTKTTDGNFKCLCCPFNSKKLAHVIDHISCLHPQYVHEPRKSIRFTLRDGLRRGIKNWTKEELADPNKKIHYTTSQLERENGRYKCLECSFSSPRCDNIIFHISSKHPKFIRKHAYGETNSRKNVSRGINIWTKEELADPNKELHYMTKDLEKVEERYKCFCCSYETLIRRDIVRHISSNHPRFRHTPEVRYKSLKNLNNQKYPRRGIKTWAEEDVADPKKILSFTSGDLEKIDRKFKCLVCSYTSIYSRDVCRHIGYRHPKFIHKGSNSGSNINVSSSTSDTTSNSDRKMENICYKMKIEKTNSLSTSPRRRSLRGRKSVDYAESQISSDSPSYGSNSDVEMMDDYANCSNDVSSHNEITDDSETEDRGFENNRDEDEFYINERTCSTRNICVLDDHGHVHRNSNSTNGFVETPYSTFRNFEEISDEKSPFLLLPDQQSSEVNKTLVFANGNGLRMDIQNGVVEEKPFVDVTTNESCRIYVQNQMEHFPGSVETFDSVKAPEKDDSFKDKDALLRELQLTKERLISMECLNVKHEKEIARLNLQLNKIYEVDMNQLLDVKEEKEITDSHSNTDQDLLRQLDIQRIKFESQLKDERKIFENDIAAKQKEFEELSSKVAEMRTQLERLLDVKSHLTTYKRVSEMSDEADRLEDEEVLGQKSVDNLAEIITETKNFRVKAIEENGEN